MIVVMAEVETSEESLASMKEAIQVMETASRAEPGCHEYVFSQETSNPEKVRILELWESMEALEAHFGEPHMAAFNAALGANPPRSMTLKIYELGKEQSLPGAGG